MNMNVMLYFFTSTLFFIFLIRNILFWLHLWQIKEYRFDRLFIHLTETHQGRNLIFNPMNIFKLTVFFVFFATIFWTDLYPFYPFVVLIVYILSCIEIGKEFASKQVRVPVITFKILVIFFLTFLIEIVLFSFHLLDKFFWFLFLDKITPFVIAIFIILFSLPGDFYKDIIINRAIKKLSKYKKILVIGITGSYGKGSTKEYLAKILSYKFSVLSTYATYNTPIGIAKTILSGLTGETKIFVVEMGAYKKGEIAEMASMVKPKIGILTAVNDQHSSLFGSIANTKIAKYELIESLPRDGTALFNGNNPYTRVLYKTSNKKKILYCVNTDHEKVYSDVVATSVTADKYSISFTVRIKNKNVGQFTAPVLGKHNIENILPGIFIASTLGMSPREIREAVSMLSPLSKTMTPLIHEGVTFIDDTYNANPAAVLAALDYMKVYKGKKILVLQPMIELGKQAKNDHYEVAYEIGKVCQYLILTNKNFSESIERGVKDSKGKCHILFLLPKQIKEFISSHTKTGDVVVFEGKEAGIPLSLIVSRKK